MVVNQDQQVPIINAQDASLDLNLVSDSSIDLEELIQEREEHCTTPSKRSFQSITDVNQVAQKTSQLSLSESEMVDENSAKRQKSLSPESPNLSAISRRASFHCNGVSIVPHVRRRHSAVECKFCLFILEETQIFSQARDICIEHAKNY